jgi:uncharacterized cofD-like protein
MSTSRATLPRQSRLNRAIVVLGGGRGLAVVLQALRQESFVLTVIVSIAYEQGQADEGRPQQDARTVEDLRHSLELLTDEEDALLRAIRRPLSIERLGRQPLGNLVLASVALAFDDYGRASVWLGEQLGVAGAVLPATTQPSPYEIEAGYQSKRLTFTTEDAETPEPVITAIKGAQCVLLAPGSLYESVLCTAAVPAVAAALASTSARVIWIANLEAREGATANMTAIDHLRALTLHGVRVDAVLHDPSAPLRFDGAELESHGVESIARTLRGDADRAVHDPERLCATLRELIESSESTAVTGRAAG